VLKDEHLGRVGSSFHEWIKLKKCCIGKDRPIYSPKVSLLRLKAMLQEAGSSGDI